GGIATPSGTATNVVALGFLKRPEVVGRSLDFLAWCAVGVPMMALIFAGTYAWLRLLAPAGDLDMPALRDYLRAECDRLGSWKRGEINTVVVFLVVVALWITPGVLALAAPGEVQRALVGHRPGGITELLGPVVPGLCVEAGVDPLLPLLGVPFGASFGSSLPVSTPPNAIVYGTGLTPVRRMIVAGLGVDVAAGVVIWAVLRVAWEVLHWAPLERGG